MVLAFGMLDRCLDVIHRDERATTVEGRRTKAARWRGRALALAREAEPKQVVDLVSQRPAAFRAPTHQLGCDVRIKDDGGAHALKHTKTYADVRQLCVIRPFVLHPGGFPPPTARSGAAVLGEADRAGVDEVQQALELERFAERDLDLGAGLLG